MKRNWLLYLVIFSLALNLGTIGTLVYLRYQDQAQRLSREIPPPLPMRALWRDLKLDPSQRQALHGLFPEHRGKVMEIRGELAQKRQELFNLLSDEAPALPAVQAKVGEISVLQGKLEEELVRFLLEFKKHLKPEQSAAFLGLVQTRLDKTLGGPFGPGADAARARPGPWNGSRSGFRAPAGNGTASGNGTRRSGTP